MTKPFKIFFFGFLLISASSRSQTLEFGTKEFHWSAKSVEIEMVSGPMNKDDKRFFQIWSLFTKAVESSNQQELKRLSVDSLLYNDTLISINHFISGLYFKTFTSELISKLSDTAKVKYIEAIKMQSTFKSYIKIRNGDTGKHFKIKRMMFTLTGGDTANNLYFDFLETTNGYKFFRLENLAATSGLQS